MYLWRPVDGGAAAPAGNLVDDSQRAPWRVDKALRCVPAAEGGAGRASPILRLELKRALGWAMACKCSMSKLASDRAQLRRPPALECLRRAPSRAAPPLPAAQGPQRRRHGHQLGGRRQRAGVGVD